MSRRRGFKYDHHRGYLSVEVDGVEALRLKGAAMPINSVTLFDDFLSQQVLVEAETPWVLNSGDDAEAVDPVINTTNQQNGTLLMTTGNAGTGTSHDDVGIVGDMPWKANQGSLVFECRLHINSAITDAQVVMGFTDTQGLEIPAAISGTSITTTAEDMVLFAYDTGATTDQWYCLGSAATTDATGNAISGVAPTADTYQVFRIEVDADGAGARFYIDNVLVGTLTANACTATVALYPIVMACATTTTSKTIDVDYIYASARRA